MITKPISISKDDILNIDIRDEHKNLLANLYQKQNAPSTSDLMSLIRDTDVNVNYDTIKKKVELWEDRRFRRGSKTRFYDPESKKENYIQKDIEDSERYQKKTKLLDAIKKEFFQLLCTDNAKYEKVRKVWNSSFKEVLPCLSTALASELGVAPAILSGVVTAILITLIKIPQNAWCSTFKS